MNIRWEEEILHTRYDKNKLKIFDLMTECIKCIEYTKYMGYIGYILDILDILYIQGTYHWQNKSIRKGCHEYSNLTEY